MLDDNNIRDRFNDSDWEQEDWLQPDALVFDNISKEIFEEEKSKRNYWIWILLGLLLTIPFLIWFFNRPADLASIHSQNQEESTFKTAEIGSSATPNSPKTEELSLTDASNETVAELERVKSEIPAANEAISNQPKEIKATKKVERAVESRKEIVPISEDELMTKSELLVSNQENNGELAATTSEENRNLGIVNELPMRTTALLDIQEQTFEGVLLSNEMDENGEDTQEKTQKFSWNYGLGLSLWDVNLNQSYSNVLEGANYKQILGKGALLQSGVSMDLGDRWNLNMTLGFERVYLSSGHNSDYLYDRASESSDLKNSTSLTMASPLGFVTTPITIERDMDQQQQNTYDLILDLDNRHVVNNLDLGLALEYNLIARRNFSSGLSVGMGVQQIISIENDLTSIKTNHDDFKALNVDMVEEQKNYNKFRPYFNLSYSASQRISDRHHVVLSYAFRKDLKQIFESGDFAADLERHLITLGIRTSLNTK